VTDKDTTGKGGADKANAKDFFFKPYKIKPAEVYAEPGPGGCTKDKTN